MGNHPPLSTLPINVAIPCDLIQNFPLGYEELGLLVYIASLSDPYLIPCDDTEEKQMLLILINMGYLYKFDINATESAVVINAENLRTFLVQ